LIECDRSGQLGARAVRAGYPRTRSRAPGIDGVTFEAIEAQGVEALLEQLRDELTGRTYKPLPARKHEIPKDGGKVRVLSIPAIRDRVVQGALKLILEPVFEADFQPGSYGYRPKRTAHDAIKRVAEAIAQRKTRVLDFDDASTQVSVYPPVRGLHQRLQALSSPTSGVVLIVVLIRLGGSEG
jgi:retron-type reverse transcriptase